MSVTVEIKDAIAVVRVNNPPVNALSHAVRQGLLAAVHKVETAENVKAALLICEGRTFIAGADVREFNKPAQEPSLPQVIDAIEACPKPWVAAIHGSALGGGFEVALGCHYRIADRSAKVGLPEVTLGLIPGAGGTVRLPRLTPISTALEMITTGKPVAAEQAKALGILDALITGDLLETAQAFTRGIIEHPRPLATRDRTLPQAAPPPQFWESASAVLTKKAKGQKSPLVALEAVKNAVELTFEESYARERELFLQLRTSDQAKALRHVFFAERASSKLEGLADIRPRPVEKVAIIGGGTMGAGIALCFINAGFEVTLVERDQPSLEAGADRIRGLLQASAKRGLITEEAAEEKISSLHQTTDYTDLAEIDLAIEAVFENMAIKKQVFQALDQALKPNAILATNTSYLDVNEIARTTDRPSDVIGLHFFSPAHIMKLLEIVEAAPTAPDVLATGFALAKRLGKIGIRSGVCDGFIGNRILKVYRKHSERLLLEGATPHQVDSAMRAFGLAMGPFEMQDLAGLDIAAAQRTAAREQGQDVFAPISDRLCALERFGQKRSKGWYVYQEGARAPIEDEEVNALIREIANELGTPQQSRSEQQIQQAILLPMINEACFILEEGIAARPLDIDLVEIHGYGFPRWRGGLMHYADTIGTKTILKALQTMDGVEPSPLLERLATTSRSFADLD
ncbi:FAD-dependent oxidoreductase [Pseudovibrio sp. SPO723]|uniref:FAD-dependent oxidoreductase n=1 Tax=Nesiotobacter zosterae TaxID=392721 RepID=UPI0029C5A256|nr:FAD-dependent oxidoreductase [Pseudovibrio sp. SPO723]MDX5593554.1 3-hydroxyacyl-CoA dehydrogenase NAD-binding domain-containing protein [Pseudovibrio sp. SPO723]